MDIQQYIDSLLSQLKNSPLTQAGTLPELDQITSELTMLRDKLDQPLRVSLIGEVKSGKSTLINAFAGGAVSPTNATETTACIMKIEYAPQEHAIIYYTNGGQSIGTIEEIFALLKTKENNQEFFSRCDHVLMQMPLKGLQHIQLVDTPGLGTITRVNAERTQNFFQAVDVVLWIFNGNYLGQSDINDSLRKVAQMGKPIVAVINRIDQVSGDPRDLADYVEDTMGIYIDAIFLLSAKKAFDGVITGNMDLQQKSGFTDLYKYLDENIDHHVDKVQMESICSSVNVIDKRIQLIHHQVLEQIKHKMKTYQELDDRILYSSGLMKDKVNSDVQHWLQNKFLSDAKLEMNSRINSLGVFSSDMNTQIKTALQQFLSEEQIKEELQQYLSDLALEIHREWQGRLADIDKELSDLYHNTLQKDQMETQQLLNQFSGESGNMDAVKNTLAGAVTFGGALSVYSAVLGPAAAHVTLGAAAVSIMPPILFAGVAAGAVFGYARSKKQKNQFHTIVDTVIFSCRTNVAHELMPKLQTYLDTICRETQCQAKEDFVKNNFNGHSVEELKNIYYRLQDVPIAYEKNDRSDAANYKRRKKTR